MGTLANSIFQAMLGWVRSLSAQVWTTASSPESGTFLRWIGENWKLLAAGLCLVGMALDLIIYLFRWQPYRAWRSFFRRRRLAREEEEAFQEEEIDPQYDYMQAEAEPNRRENHSTPLTGPGDEFTRATEEDAWSRPAEAWERPQPERTTAAFEQAILPRKRRRVAQLLAEDAGETATPDQLIDQYAAYRRPVYPRSWKAEEGDEG